jgi:hypothetical protein
MPALKTWMNSADHHGVEQKRDNEMEPLQFPLFHRELLVQNFWNAGDQLGRVRVLISEGYLTSSKRFERIKNIIAFSFQHAPLGQYIFLFPWLLVCNILLLEILESSAIAWPNPGMWQQAQIHAQYLAATMLPSTTAARDLGDHAHSPRDKGSSSRTRLPSLGGNATYSSYAEDYPRISDVLFDSALGWRRTSGTDVSMPDYSSCGSNANESRRTTNPTGEAETGTTLQSAGAFGTMCDRLLTPAAEKSPKDVKISIKRSASVEAQIHDRKTGATSPSPDPVLEARLRIPKTRKENTRQCPVIITSPAPAEPSRDDAQPPVITRSGTKRPRLATPKAFDEMGEENEPTISPTRKASQAMTRPVGTRRVLSTVEYNIR